MQNVAATSNKRSMKNNQNPATAHHTIMTAQHPDNIHSSILVRGRSIRSMARSCHRLRRPLPRKDSHFCHFGGVFNCERRVVAPNLIKMPTRTSTPLRQRLFKTTCSLPSPPPVPLQQPTTQTPPLPHNVWTPQPYVSPQTQVPKSPIYSHPHAHHS